MAGQLPSFVTGATVVIRIGDTRIAYCQNLRLSARMDTQSVFGIGSSSAHALEPIMHSANFSMQILRYTNGMKKLGDTVNRTANTLPENVKQGQNASQDGNSIINSTFMNPQLLLLSATFDIDVYERNFEGSALGVEGQKIFTLKDCRIANYSFSFAPGELLIENVSGLARQYQEAVPNISEGTGTQTTQPDNQEVGV